MRGGSGPLSVNKSCSYQPHVGAAKRFQCVTLFNTSCHREKAELEVAVE